MIDPSFFNRIKGPTPPDQDLRMTLMRECYRAVGNLSGEAEIIEFIDNVIKAESGYAFIYCIFVGLRIHIDDGPMTLASFGVVNQIGDSNNSRIKDAIFRLREVGIKAGLDENQGSEDGLRTKDFWVRS